MRILLSTPIRLLWLFMLICNSIYAANWAQVSGHIDQNIAVPYFPGPNQPHWGARYGMVSVVAKASNLSGANYMYILGGDTYDGVSTSKSQDPGLLDLNWGMGYKNDVWRMNSAEWLMKGDPRLRGPYHQKIPKVQAILEWDNVGVGILPEVGQTYQDFIKCETFFQNQPYYAAECSEDDRTPTQWSPRRHHAGIYFQGYIWILGGRARELVELPETRSIGGIIDKRVKDIHNVRDQRFTTQREASVVKNDVWRSSDGRNWELVTPGCRAPQKNLVARGFLGEGKAGIKAFACDPTAVITGCYGAEECDAELKTCVCTMWSPREQHAVSFYGGRMYISGGYASQLYSQFSNCGPYACGDTDASGYRYFMSDVWTSTDGQKWDPIIGDAWVVPGFPPLGRGGHQMLTITMQNIPYLYVFGGRGGDNSVDNGDPVYYNDVWRAPIGSDGFVDAWQRVMRPTGEGSEASPNSGSAVHNMPWEPRTGLTVVLEPGTPTNQNLRTLYLYGGINNGTYLEDLWSWRLDDPNEGWREDFTTESYYSTGVGEEFIYSTDSPSKYYVTPDSDLNMLQRYWVPVTPDSDKGKSVEKRIYLSEEKVKIMNSVGIYTIRELAEVDLYTLLKLRGFDYPQVPASERLQLYDVCDYRALAIALVDKCSLNIPSLFDGQRNMPWNIIPEFGGPPPFEDKIKWHGRDNYDFLLPDVDDPDVRTEKWDGCTYDPKIQGLFGPNVDGLGYVDQVLEVRDPQAELQELFCRQTPGPRAHHTMVIFEERLYLLGGKGADTKLHADTWYRDAKLPIARFGTIPGSRDTYPWFHFLSDKSGSYFEYRVWDPNLYKEIRPWTKVTHKTSVAWLDWRMGGPGNGRYQLYVRAVDPAGNRDARFIMGENVYNWYYLSPTPWDIILGTIFGFLFLCFLAYLEYRRRVKKAAMERYAMKRMRRKFKAMQRDINGRSVDWRTLYMESKAAEEAGVKDKKKKKKTRDKNAEKREKDRKKREKEKELIKKKLQASKTHKDKIKKEKDLEAVMDSEPNKKIGAGGKKNRVVPGSGIEDDDSELGLEDMLLMDEQKSTKAKPVAKGGKKGTAGVAIGDINDGIEGSDAPPSSIKQKTLPGVKSPHTTSNNTNTIAIVSDSSKEIAAGQLKATADMETGTKQRKINKKLQEYDSNNQDNQPETRKDL